MLIMFGAPGQSAARGDYATLLRLDALRYSKRPVSKRYLTGGGNRSNNFLGSFSEIIPPRRIRQ